ncbi:MAG: hypothetical protein ACM369_03895 [Acidobacteriota bacterium]
MKTLMRTLTLSAAALAALVAAPKSDAQQFRRGEARETFRGSPGHGGSFRGGDFRGREFRGHEFRGGDFRGREFRGYGGYGRYGGYGGYGWHNRGYGYRGYSYGGYYGRHYVSPFRVYAGSRFYSDCPGPGYVYVDDLGWAFPPFPGARWFRGYVDGFGVQIDGCWR